MKRELKRLSSPKAYSTAMCLFPYICSYHRNHSIIIAPEKGEMLNVVNRAPNRLLLPAT